MPRKRPARRIRTVPGWRLSRTLAGRSVLRTYMHEIKMSETGFSSGGFEWVSRVQRSWCGRERPDDAILVGRSSRSRISPIATGLVEFRQMPHKAQFQLTQHRCRIRPGVPTHICLLHDVSMQLPGYTDFLGLRLIVHGVPLLGLLGRVRHSPLTLSKLLRLANSSVRHGGCWDEDGVGGCRVGGWVLEVDVRTCEWSPV